VLHYDQYGLHGSLRVKTRTGLYYKAGKDRLLRFVLSQDTVGSRPTRIFYSTDVSLTPRQILSIFSRRGSIEVTHYDCKQHLGLEDPVSAPVEAFEQSGVSPVQATVTGLKSTVVTALSTDRVESNLRRMTSP
jgi:hypothetical protein